MIRKSFLHHSAEIPSSHQDTRKRARTEKMRKAKRPIVVRAGAIEKKIRPLTRANPNRLTDRILEGDRIATHRSILTVISLTFLRYGKVQSSAMPI